MGCSSFQEGDVVWNVFHKYDSVENNETNRTKKSDGRAKNPFQQKHEVMETAKRETVKVSNNSSSPSDRFFDSIGVAELLWEQNGSLTTCCQKDVFFSSFIAS